MGNSLENAGKPWTEEEIFLVGSYIPNKRNISYLAKHLKRTEHAIQYMYCKLYSKTTTLKNKAGYEKILNVRRQLGIAIGL